MALKRKRMLASRNNEGCLFKRWTAPGRDLTVAFVIFSLAVSAGTFFMAKGQGMARRLPDPFCIYEKSAAIAISEMKFGLSGYVGYQQIADTLREEGLRMGGDPDAANRAIASALTLKDPRSALIGIYENDVGYVDYCRLAFGTFGYRIESLFYIYFVLLLVQAAFFVREFRRVPLAMAGLAVFAVSHHLAVMATTGVGDQLASLHNYRFLPVLGILPVAHVCLLLLLRKKFSVGTLLGAVIQCGIFLFVLRIRGAAFWMAGPLLLSLAVAVRFLWREFYVGQAVRFRGRHLIAGLWPAGLLGVMLGIMLFANSYFLHPTYFDRDAIRHHPVWHPVFVGLALHPAIRDSWGDRFVIANFDIDASYAHACSSGRQKKGGLKDVVRKGFCYPPFERPAKVLLRFQLWRNMTEGNDQDGYYAAFKWNDRAGRPVSEMFTFPPDENVDLTSFDWIREKQGAKSSAVREGALAPRRVDAYREMRWNKFDRIMRDVVFEVIRTQPVQVITAIVVIKPFLFLLNYAQFYLFSAGIWSALFVFAALALLAVLMRSFPPEDLRVLPATSAVMFICSMGLSLLAFPASYVISEQALLFSMCIFSFVLYRIRKLSVPGIRERSIQDQERKEYQ